MRPQANVQRIHAALNKVKWQNIDPIEIEVDIGFEVEDHCQPVWDEIKVTGSFETTSVEDLTDFLKDVSIEVSKDTDATYRRCMKLFDLFLQQKKYIQPGETIFRDKIPAETPIFVVAWIMVLCDPLNVDGTFKPPGTIRSYGYTTKLRSAMTYGFGRHFRCGTGEWHYNSETGDWAGNPSISTEVGRYMVSLKRRKHELGDKFAMSSRAITSDVIRRLYDYNNDEDRSIIMPYSGRSQNPDDWGTPRRRILVHAVITIAFTCLMRLDEVLNLRFEDIKVMDERRIDITLSSRKTHPYGGSRPYHLWKFPEEDRKLCPILALAHWIEASELKDGYIFRRPIGARAPANHIDSPISSSAFLDLFRHNLLDIGITEAGMYGGHSFRRGGCQWLIKELRWDILRVCDWGGWSKDFNHSSIIRYLFSWNDDPYDPRDQYFNPDNRINMCRSCGRCCGCRY